MKLSSCWHLRDGLASADWSKNVLDLMGLSEVSKRRSILVWTLRRTLAEWRRISRATNLKRAFSRHRDLGSEFEVGALQEDPLPLGKFLTFLTICSEQQPMHSSLDP